MKHRFAFFGSLTGIAILSTAIAHAQTRSFITGDSGLYWSVDAGATIPQDGHITHFGPFSSGQKLTYDVGGGFDVGVGYFFNKFVATELQTGGSWNSISSIEGASLHDTYFSTVPILANLILQYPIANTRVVPYVGGGAGGAATFFNTDNYYQPVPGGAVSLHGSDSDFVFAWQAMAGLRLQLNSKMAVGLGYRFLHADSSSYNFESWHHGPDLEFGISSHESHMAALTFQMKF